MSYPSLSSTVSGRSRDTTRGEREREREKGGGGGFPLRNFYNESINPKLANRKQRPRR